MIIEKLKAAGQKQSTKHTYLSVWRKFNSFLIKLDIKPPSWEERTVMFIAFCVEEGAQSSTVKSYISAIKRILINDGYIWNDQLVLLSSLTRA